MVSVAEQTKSLPRISTAQSLRRLRQLVRQPLSLLTELSQQGEITPFLNNQSFLLNSPQLAYAVVVQHAADVDRSVLDRGNLLPLVGDGVLSAVEPRHRSQRKLLAPTFNHKRVMAYGETMAAISERLQQSWQDGDEVELHQTMVHVTLEIVAQALFGVSIEPYFAQLFASISELAELVTFNSMLGMHLPRSWPTPNNLRYRRALRNVDTILYTIIAERRQNEEDRGDFLSMLLQTRDAETGEGMSDQQVRDEAMTIFLAGHETTANALSWAWYLLMRHPESYDRLVAETKTLNGRSPTVADLPNLPYTQQVFKETMRLYPPSWFMDRQVMQPIDVEGYHFPVGTILAVSSYQLHRQAQYFPDPEQFNPERFAAGQEEQWPRMAYMPFGDGPRICLGNHFALLEGQLILATLTQRVRFEPLSQKVVPPYPVVTLRPGGPIPARVHRL